MADLTRPKETATPKPVEDRPPETEEEREKRLRKEKRRKLRVTWKPEHSLTEVRLFTHDPDEELGPGDGARTEVGDVKGEGSILKLQRPLEEEDDEDYVGIGEVEILPYHIPLGWFCDFRILFDGLSSLTCSPLQKPTWVTYRMKSVAGTSSSAAAPSSQIVRRGLLKNTAKPPRSWSSTRLRLIYHLHQRSRLHLVRLNLHLRSSRLATPPIISRQVWSISFFFTVVCASVLTISL